MIWLKSVLLDILVTALILAAVLTQVELLDSIVVVYTLFMLILKIAGVLGQGVVNALRSGAGEAPVWFVYLLYGINILALLLAAWWWTALQWIAIAGLSEITRRRRRQ